MAKTRSQIRFFQYLKAQEIVEGQRRDMDLMQKNHLRFSEQLTKELKTAKVLKNLI